MALTKETVAIPVVKGINLRTAARLVDPPGLLEAQNARFSGDGSSKRYGHQGVIMRTGSYPTATRPELSKPELTPYGEKILSTNWLYGWGDLLTPTMSTADTQYPEAGYLFGTTSRDNELLAWNGSSLYSYAPSQASQGRHPAITTACMPVLRAKPIAKSPRGQTQVDAASNGTVRIVVWLDDPNNGVRYSLYDELTGAPLKEDQLLSGPVNPFNPRCFTLGNNLHIALVDRDDSLLKLYSIAQDDVSTVTQRSQGACANYYDFWKVDETAAVFLRNDGTNLKTVWIKSTGEPSTIYTGVTLTLDDSVPIQCGIAVHPQSGRVGVIWINDGTGATAPDTVRLAIYPSGSATSVAKVTLESVAAGEQDQPNRVTIAPTYLYAASSADFFHGYYALTTGTAVITRRKGVLSSGSISGTHTRYNYSLASHAFRVGQKTFVWGSFKSTLQSVWLLLDDELKPVGKLAFGVANVQALNLADTGGLENTTMASVNYRVFGPQKDVFAFQCALGYRIRVATTSDTNGLFTEPSIKYVEMDFLPYLRAAQAGRATYIAGAQLWSYDGKELTEAGFHLCPEPTIAESGGGALTTTGAYSYRVDLCYKNAQNEEIRSHSILTSFTLTGANQTLTLTIPTVITRRSDSYFLIYRNAIISGTPTVTWNLINSRDPSSADYRKNDLTAASVTFADAGAVTDTAGLSRELHPANVNTFLHPFAAPACEVVASGRDRLWVAGGELLPGEVAPSRLFTPYDTPAFNSNINIQIDRSDKAVTAIGFVGEVAVVFRSDAVYLQEGDGPDNNASGYFPPSRLAMADVGCISQDSLGLITPGLAFQSPVGYRLIGPSGQLVPMGVDIDPLAQGFDVRGAFVSTKDQEIRFYGIDQVHVFNYLDGVWSTWTCGAVGVTKNQDTQRAVLARWDGSLWLEDDEVFLDSGSAYEHRIKFPWLHAGALGDFQRLSSFAAFGTAKAATHNIAVEIAYDERDFPEEYWEWTYPDDSQNEDTWGAGSWGDGVWGDTTAGSDSLEDSVWRWRRDPRIQKCSVFSITISDNFSPNAGFSLVALGLRLGKKPGLDRIPRVTGGYITSR